MIGFGSGSLVAVLLEVQAQSKFFYFANYASTSAIH